MFLILLFYLLNPSGSAPSTTNPKPCQQCIHYIKPLYNDKYDIGNYFGKCIKFMNYDKPLAEIDYKYAIIARTKEEDCGIEGKHFTSGVSLDNIPSL